MSGIVSFAISIYEATKKKKFETWAFFLLGAICLIIGFDQAWQDEHRNAQLLAGQKADAVGERNFWKDQSYAKDEALRSRDQLLAQNYAALIGQQTTSNKSQQSLAQLSNKIVELNAGCYRPDRRLTSEQREYLFKQLKRIADDIRKQKKEPTIQMRSFSGDLESSNFERALWEVFTNAGWTVPVDASQKAQDNRKEDEEWVFRHGIIVGVAFMEPPSSKGPSMWLGATFSQPELGFANQWLPFTDVPPHVDSLTMWVGYKAFP